MAVDEPQGTSPETRLADLVVNTNGGVKRATGSMMDLTTELDLASLSKEIEDELLDAGLDRYQLYLDELDASKDHLDSLLSDTNATLDLLAGLSASFRAVENQTSAFQTQSEGLLSEQSRNEKLAGDILGHLRPYDYLEPITRRLNAPGAGNFVRGRDFSEMLIHLDEAIDYMQTHPKEREAETYRSRYRLLLTRALTLVRQHFVGALRETAMDVSKRVADRQLNDTTMSALLYAKFRVGAAEMKNLGLEIQKRAVPPADAEPETEGEYQNLMNELHANFAATRGRLIIPLVRKRLTEIAQAPSSSKDIITFARSSISYIRGICLDEFDLWGAWFHGQRGLYDFLESVCESLYDHLRPRIIHESKLAKLCQLCVLLQTRYMQDPDDEVEQLPDPSQLDFALLIRPALEDTQTRIVFRTQAIVRNDIELFKPKPEDLDYPRRLRRRSSTHQGKEPVLSGRKNSSLQPTTPTTPLPRNPLVVDEDVSSDEEDPTRSLSLPYSASATLARQTIYPTLNLCLTLLSRLHRLIHTSIFDDLAHQIVYQTLISLSTASNQIPVPKPPAPTPKQAPSSPTPPPKTPPNLFLLSHLLHLKTHLLAFDISSSTLNPDISVDFSGPLSTFAELRERGGLFNPVNLMRLLGNGTLLPRVVENMLDAKVELDGKLRGVINDLVNDWSSLMTDNLTSLPTTNPTTKPTKKDPNSTQPDISKHAAEKVEKTRDTITRSVPLLRSTLDTWVSEPRVRETLVAAVMESVVRTYEVWFEGSGITGAGRKGKGREDAVWDVDGFEEWCAGVFDIRRVETESIEDDDDGEDGRSV